MHRRDLLKAAAALAAGGFPATQLFAAAAAANAADTQSLRHLGQSTPFDYARLKGQARALSAQPYKATPRHASPEIDGLDWNHYQALHYRNDRALWSKEKAALQVRFFHLGMNFKSPVKIFELQDGQAQELAYDPTMFDYGNSGLHGDKLPADLGFAGFRVSMGSDLQRDIFSFLGASYFRAVGGELQFGVSARGLAIDSGLSRPEEFPEFTTFWLERPAAGAKNMVVYALLDSPSIAGAYRFDIRSGEPLTMDVDAALYPRKAIERLGVAPLTSMYMWGESDRPERRGASDWRPEIHDSDGLAMWRGNGERLWRPLTNPANGLHFNAYLDDNPKGFGLLQRDRVFDHYQDDVFHYERRPSLWIEPRSGFGKGAVHLIEIPTADETFDNIVAYWNPQDKPQPGQELLYAYRLHWGARLPLDTAQPPLANVIATRTGIGGEVGVVGIKRTYFSWRFVVDFAGGKLATLPRDARVQATASASRGALEFISARPLEDVRGYRAIFDLKPDAANGPIDLRLFLTLDGTPLSETWLYQWTPPAQRTF